MIQFHDYPSTFITGTLVSVTLLLTCIVAFVRHYREMKAENNQRPLSRSQRKVLVVPTVGFFLVLISYTIIFL